MEDNEFISKLINLGRPELLYLKEDAENARIALIEMRRSHWLSKDAIEAADFALAFIHQFLRLTQDEQQAILASIDRAARIKNGNLS